MQEQIYNRWNADSLELNDFIMTFTKKEWNIFTYQFMIRLDFQLEAKRIMQTTIKVKIIGNNYLPQKISAIYHHYLNQESDWANILSLSEIEDNNIIRSTCPYLVVLNRIASYAWVV